MAVDDNLDPDYQRAANGYLVWPLALNALVREPPGASSWLRIHVRQAFVFGLVVSVGYVLLLALPMIVVIFDPQISTGTTVAVYSGGLVADVLVFFALAALSLSYASKAARGELFTIPLVGALADRLFRRI